MKTIFHTILLAASLSLATHAYAEERASANEAVAMVHKVVAKIKADGKDRVIAEINDFSPEFKDRDLYVTIMDMTGMELAHGANKRMQGVNLFDLKDQAGKFFIRERLEIAKAKGKGWQDYDFVNPATKTVEPKSMYFEKYEDMVVSAGIYKKK